ncbi:MAG: hypothetical protein R3224_08015, partial [Balneolaceae bacterium]|nr:hypothetical protein [Balneolaceae bacterium]
MKRTISLTVTILLLLAAIYGGYRLLPYLYPGYYFEHNTGFNQFSVYSDSTLGDNVIPHLNEAVQRIQGNTLYPAYAPSEFRIYICYDPGLYGYFARLIDQNQASQAFTLEPFGHIFINPYGLRTVRRLYGSGELYEYSLLAGEAVHIFAHELMHVLITRKIGMFESKELPTWKREGYAEYAASIRQKRDDRSYSLGNRAEAYFSGAYDHVVAGRRFYIRNAMIVE